MSISHDSTGPSGLRLDWKGRSDEHDPSLALRPFLTMMLEVARKEGAGIELHFEEVEYFNSSTVAVLLDFVVHARRDRVPLRFIYSGAVRWQRLSFDALKVVSSLDPGVQVVSLDAHVSA